MIIFKMGLFHESIAVHLTKKDTCVMNVRKKSLYMFICSLRANSGSDKMFGNTSARELGGPVGGGVSL